MNQKLANCVCVADVERLAAARLPADYYDYYRSGADEEQTLARNIKAYRNLLIRPFVLRNVSHTHSSVTIRLRQNNLERHHRNEFHFASPIGIAPTAFHRMAHDEGEIATVRAASRSETLMICSTLSTTSLEDVARNATTGSTLWFQLYVYKDRKMTQELVERAILAGFSALVLTVDAPTMGRRRADERNGFELPSHLRMANFDVDLFARTEDGSVGSSGFAKYSKELFDMSLDWTDLEWLVRFASSIPVLVKGIVRGDDAQRALKAGVAAIIVSNHGGRQLDHCPATIEVLEEVLRAVDGQCPVFIDGGIRCGADIFKALALGAQMVFLGRAIVYGLAAGGQQGVEHVIRLLRLELEYAMRLSGCASIADIRLNSKMVVHKRELSML